MVASPGCAHVRFIRRDRSLLVILAAGSSSASKGRKCVEARSGHGRGPNAREGGSSRACRCRTCGHGTTDASHIWIYARAHTHGRTNPLARAAFSDADCPRLIAALATGQLCPGKAPVGGRTRYPANIRNPRFFFACPRRHVLWLGASSKTQSYDHHVTITFPCRAVRAPRSC